MTTLNKDAHIEFLKRIIQAHPIELIESDTNWMTIAFFAISGLDVLGVIHVLDDRKEQIIDWIYSLQVLPSGGQKMGGFRGSPQVITHRPEEPVQSGCPSSNPIDTSHIANTYTALASLIILGDDLSRVDSRAVVASLSNLQLPNGSLKFSESTENDMRCIYCAASISYMLQDWSGINVPLMKQFIEDSWTYDGAIGQICDAEGHGGPTFCAIASLFLLGQSEISDIRLKNLTRWCLNRSGEGFQGRPNKLYDTCYSFWIGATLKLLERLELVDQEAVRNAVLATQDPRRGGLAKCCASSNDPLHTYFGLAGLSLLGMDDLQPIHPALNITQRAFQHLQHLHSTLLTPAH